MKKIHKVIKVKGKIRDGKGRIKDFIPEIDNGCQLTCINPAVVKREKLRTIKLRQPILMSNADGSAN